MRTPSKNRRVDWKILELLKWATGYFGEHDIDSPRSTAEILLAYTLAVQRIDLYLRYDQPLNDTELAAFKGLIKRRVAREPVAYIVGQKEFWGLDFKVGPGTLIPRPETEHLVEAALEVIQAADRPAPWKILELGTGSGAVVTALAKEQPEQRYFASDRSVTTLQRACRNAAANGLAAEIHFFSGNWFTPLSPVNCRFDMVVSNPPYIETATIQTLQPEITRFEPLAALDGGADGLGCIRRILDAAPKYMAPGGCLILETGNNQHPAIEKLVTRHPEYARVEFSKDYSGYDRIARLTLGA